MTPPELQEPPLQYHRPHDRWQCSADKVADETAAACGGSGIHRDVDCTPAPSLRFRRGMFVTACTALIGGFLIVMFSSPNRNEFLKNSSYKHIFLIRNSPDACRSIA